MKSKKIKGITFAAIVAALYVVLTLLSAAFGLSGGVVQVRISEALSVLPYFSPYAIPGLFIGCIMANLITGCIITDIIFGGIATLIGAVGAYFVRKHRYLVPLPNIISNTLIIPFILSYAYHVPDGLSFLFMTVGIGEIISGGLLGYFFMGIFERINKSANIF
ncbi:MAG: QueT transporter family protein [Ruminococcaceae bacterium]|nr:QueT transporter family protein [Oscillospiraceae bacterium]